MNGFVYKSGEDYALRMGNSMYILDDNIADIKQDVEIEVASDWKLLDGYSLGIDKIKKIWRIRDTGHKNCKDVIKTGNYLDGFEESLRPFLNVFGK